MCGGEFVICIFGDPGVCGGGVCPGGGGGDEEEGGGNAEDGIDKEHGLYELDVIFWEERWMDRW